VRIPRIFIAVVLTLSSLPLAGFAPTPKPSASGTPPPEIYHVVTTPLCARLHERIRPAVALILENDQVIAKSPALFKKYSVAVFGAPSQDNSNGNGAPGGNDSINVSSPATNMALQQMSYLVSPIAQNIIAAQKILTDGELDKPTGNAADDQQLAKLKASLMETIAFQSASLDLINGFVATQQMGELQHAGETYLSAITGTNTSTQLVTPATPSALQDPNSPGLPPSPYMVDPLAIPGLQVGYNPLTRIMGGLDWTRGETSKRENADAIAVSAAIKQCASAR
jgi:hypothetical protein